MRRIFKQALANLKNELDRQPCHIIESYTQNHLRELELLALITPEFGQDPMEFLKELKKLLKIKRKSFPGPPGSTMATNESPYHEMQMQVIKPENNKILAFNYKEIKDDKLALVLHALIKLKAISHTTTLPQFRALFNGREVDEPLEWWAAQGDLMVFIRETVRINEQRFTSYNQHWNIAVKCFLKKGGKGLFDPQKLRNSKPTLLEQKFIAAARKFK
jgi:hypothetical protein